MCIRNYKLFLLTLILVLTAGAAIASSNQAKPTALKRSFERAVQASSQDYLNIRDAITAKGPSALSLLKEKASDPDWHVRVLAEAMIGRVENPERYAIYEYRLITPISNSGGYQKVTFYSLERATTRAYVNSDVDILHFLANRVHRKANLGAGGPCYAEIALKGSLLRKPTVPYQLPDSDADTTYTMDQVADILHVDRQLATDWMASNCNSFIAYTGGPQVVKYISLKGFVNGYLKPPSASGPDPVYIEKSRCCAMLMLGDMFNDYPATLPLLTELLQSHESTMIRGYAALALGITGKPEAAEPLRQALNDPDKQVGEAAQRALDRLNRIIEVKKERNLN